MDPSRPSPKQQESGTSGTPGGGQNSRQAQLRESLLSGLSSSQPLGSNQQNVSNQMHTQMRGYAPDARSFQQHTQNILPTSTGNTNEQKHTGHSMNQSPYSQVPGGAGYNGQGQPNPYSNGSSHMGAQNRSNMGQVSSSNKTSPQPGMKRNASNSPSPGVSGPDKKPRFLPGGNLPMMFQPQNTPLMFKSLNLPGFNYMGDQRAFAPGSYSLGGYQFGNNQGQQSGNHGSSQGQPPLGLQYTNNQNETAPKQDSKTYPNQSTETAAGRAPSRAQSPGSSRNATEQVHTASSNPKGDNQTAPSQFPVVPPQNNQPGFDPHDPNLKNRDVKVGEALKYLESVKTRFPGRPEVYNSFINIMKRFRAGKVDAPGIIKEMLVLFKEFPDLITGFNDFLPTGYKVDITAPKGGNAAATGPQRYRVMVHLKDMAPFEVDPNTIGNEALLDTAHGGKTGNSTMPSMPPMSQSSAQRNATDQGNNALNGLDLNNPALKSFLANSLPMQLGLPQAPVNFLGGVQGMQSFSPFAALGNLASVGVPNDGQGNVQLPSVLPQDENNIHPSNPGDFGLVGRNPNEFSEAINYVSKIKKRFAHDAESYRNFLDILHTYQRDQRTVKNVLQRVSTLFDNHTDLLKEFCFFLPDDSREKAKKIVANILRMKKSQSSSSASKEKLNRFEDKYGERIMWQKIKAKLRDGPAYVQFLGILEILIKGIINQEEFFVLAEDLFLKVLLPVDGEPRRNLDETSKTLLNQLNSFLCTHNVVDSPVLSAFYSLPMSDLDFEDTFRPTPSYRQLPEAFLNYSGDTSVKNPNPAKRTYRINLSSGRTRLCDEVLNDKFVSVPTGSEDFSFKHFRKNIYEEALFRCEDERHNYDMVMEANKSTLVQLAKLQARITELTGTLGEEEVAEKKYRFKLGTGSLRVMHVKSIARLYGNYADEMLELLRVAPEKAVPIILKRLKQKDYELTKSKEKLNSEWKQVMETNFPKSLDHRSFYFKQTDRKDVGTKSLLGQIKAVYKHTTANLKGHKSEFVRFVIGETNTVGVETEKIKDAVHVELLFDEKRIHRDCFSILLFMLRKGEATARTGDTILRQQKNTSKVLVFLLQILSPFFGLEVQDFFSVPELLANFNLLDDDDLIEMLINPEGRKLLRGLKLKNARHVGDPSSGMLETGFGEGTVDSIDDQGRVRISLAFGYGFFDQKALLAHNPNLERVLEVVKKKAEKRAAHQGLKEDPGALEAAAQALLEKFGFNSGQDTVPKVFYGSSSLFLFLRLYNILYERLLRTYNASLDAAVKESEGNPVSKIESESRYNQILTYIHQLLGGAITSLEFEDHCRELLLSGGYFLFTLEKVVTMIEKHLENGILGDEKIVQVPRKLSEFAEVPSTDKLVGIYRQTYQNLMNQVDGLCYRIALFPGVTNRSAESQDNKIQEQSNIWKEKPKVQVGLTRSFPTVSLSAPGELDSVKLLLPCELSHTFLPNSILRPDNSVRAVVSGLIEDSSPSNEALVYGLLEEVTLSVPSGMQDEMIRLRASMRSRDLNESNFSKKRGAKDEWWFSGNFEEIKQDIREADEDVEMDEEEEDRVAEFVGEKHTEIGDDDNGTEADIDEDAD